jgi:uncharacterized cupin superfamily protein
MSANNLIKFGIGGVTLEPAPINPQWILEGHPVARNKVLSTSADGTANTWMWDCTAGKFNWTYDIDETVYLLEGSVTIKDHRGGTHRVSAGDTVFFPAGTSAEWTVESYVRKVAFLRIPLPKPVLFVKNVVRSLKRLVGRGGPAPAMFPSGAEES